MNKFIQWTILLLLSAMNINYAIGADVTKKSLADNDSRLQLGYGIYSPTGAPANAVCMTVTPTTFTNPQGNIFFSQTITRQQLKQYLNLSIDGKGGWGDLSASSSGSFVASSEDDNYSRNFNYLQDFSVDAGFNLQAWGIENLKPMYQSAFQQSPSAFLNYCGDSFVNNAKAGAVIAVNVKIQFNNHTDQQKFDSNVSIGGGMGNITGSIKRSNIASSMNATIQITATQRGGAPDELAKIFKNSASGYYVTQCTLNNLDACNQVINGVISYASNLSQQLRDGTGNLIQDRLFYYSPNVVQYSDIGIGNETQPLSRDVQNAQDTLLNTLKQAKQDLIFVSHYSKSPASAYFYADMRTFLVNTETALNNQIQYIQREGTKCFAAKEANQCPQVVTEMQSQFNSNSQYILDAQTLSFVKTSYRQDNFNMHIVSVTIKPNISNNYFSNGGFITLNFSPDKNKLHYSVYLSSDYAGFGDLVTADSTQMVYTGTRYWIDGSNATSTTFYKDMNPY